jgi:hypothetical protein
MDADQRENRERKRRAGNAGWAALAIYSPESGPFTCCG